MTTLPRATGLPTRRSPRRGDRAFVLGTRGFGFLIVGILIAIGIILLIDSWPAWQQFGLSLVTGPSGTPSATSTAPSPSSWGPSTRR